INAGSAYITVIERNSNSQLDQQVSYSVQVNPSVGTKLVIATNFIAGTAGTILNFADSAGLTGGNGGELTFTSSDTSVIYIDSSGQMTLKKLGRVTITVTEAGSNNYLTQSVSSVIGVNINYGTDATVTGTCSMEADGTGANVTVWSKYPTRVDVSPMNSAGQVAYPYSKIFTLQAGDTINAFVPKLELVTSKATSVVAVVRQLSDGLWIGATSIDCLQRSAGTPLTASDVRVTSGDTPQKVVVDGGNGGGLSYTSNNTSVVSIDTDGTMTFVNPGKAIITVNEAGGIYLPQSTSFSVTVLPAVGNALAVPSSNIQMDVLSSQQISVSGGNGGSISYVTDDDSIVTVDANG
ncbi:hypothetical protein ACUVMQ_21575, partial [Aeromonas veronii]|uniref:hypothetical protein n=1 Tax=Aeromonas veronii TaxID=654 RepID=UPI00405547DC